MDIAEGDTVTLKSGGTVMVAEQITVNEVKCVWQDDNGKVFRDKFYSTSLVKKIQSEEVEKSLKKKFEDIKTKSSPQVFNYIKHMGEKANYSVISKSNLSEIKDLNVSDLVQTGTKL